MKEVFLIKVLIVAGLVLPLTTYAGDLSAQQDVSASVVNKSEKITRQQDARLLAIREALAPVKSKVDLNAYLNKHQSNQSPLNALSSIAKQRFLASLKFSPKGLASFEYTDLEDKLTPTQIYKILALFGLQHDVCLFKAAPRTTELDQIIMESQDYEESSPMRIKDGYLGYRCGPTPHTCIIAPESICTDNC